MYIEIIKNKNNKKLAVELWDSEFDDFTGFKEPRPEEFYLTVNQWCIETFGYHARTAFNRFEFKKELDLTIFVLKWQ